MNNLFKIGHYSDLKNITGCTVILCPSDTVASCHVCGSAPGSRELALLSPEKKISEIHALFLTGGSAFGLNATSGVVKYLEEKKIGYKTSFAKVPLVPAAVIYDLNIGSSKIRPNESNAYQACLEADSDFFMEGSVGAGTGATIGKWSGISGAMKGGLGVSELKLDNAWVKAVSIVNSVGDVVDENGKILAGARDSKGNFIAQDDRLIRWKFHQTGFVENTVLGVILTNVIISKLQAYNLAHRAQNGLARAIIPANTSYDGDVIFALSHGKISLNEEILSEMATEALRQSIISGIRKAQSLAGVPAIADNT